MIKWISIVFLFILALSGCSFHLRHSYADLSTKYPTIILPPSGSNSLHQALYRALIASSISVEKEATSSSFSPCLVVIAQNITAQPLVYGPDGELRRERLKMSVIFSFTGSQELELTTERDRQLNPNQHLGDNAEKVVIEQEMQMDIINQILHFLATS